MESGVGKSTLCNNILRLPEGRKALTAIGKPLQWNPLFNNPPTIPILYIYTQAVRQSAINEMRKCIEKEKKRLGDVEFVPVLAEDFDLIENKYLKSYGLDNILEKTVIPL